MGNLTEPFAMLYFLQPLYFQLYAQLKHDIDIGLLTSGEQLLSERQLAAYYGISRPTARKALQNLENDGYIQAQHGRGSFVN